MNDEILKTILAIVTGVATCIPLCIQLVKYVEKATKEKNWQKLVELTMNYMSRAETMFETGADRKEWVLAMVKVSAETVNYDIDMQSLSELIDQLCSMSKIVNASSAKEEGDRT